MANAFRSEIAGALGMPATHKYHGTLVDDVKRDRERYQEKLSSSRALTVEGVPFDEASTIKEIIKGKPDIVFLDQELVEGGPSGDAAAQLGSTVAALIRKELPETPIVLITRGSIFGSELMSSSRDVPRAFDHVFIKEDVARHPKEAQDEILSIIDGFQKLQRCEQRDWTALCRLLKPRKDEVDLLSRSNPPRPSMGPKSWRASEAAYWIRRVVIRYPGILYDPLHSACFLGLAEASFESQDIQRYFRFARYKGAFAPPEGRWWKARLMRGALKFLTKSGMSGRPIHGFAAAWNEYAKNPLALSRCLVDGTHPAECVCSVYNKPVRRKNSLPYWPDNRPSIMDEARVSFKAIRESNDFDEALVATDAREMVNELQQAT